MFWKKSGRAPFEQEPAQTGESKPGPIRIERDAERPTTILKVAGELENRGAKVVELFKEINTPLGKAVLPIHLLWQDQDFFVEIETRAWKSTSVEKALDDVAVLRNSDYAEAGLGLLSAYPVPEEVNFFFGRTPVALLQLDLYAGRWGAPEERAALFVESVGRHCDESLEYQTKHLPRTEKLLTAALHATGTGSTGTLPILGALAECLGCYTGEVIRHEASEPGAWAQPESASGDVLLEIGDFVLDPIGNARAFLKNGPEDSVAYYANYVLGEIRKGSGSAS
ncbi:MAG: hypothetical protein WA990_05960 [Rubrobacteraceae bacterium]